MYILQQCYNRCTKIRNISCIYTTPKKYIVHFCWYIYNCNYTTKQHIFTT